MFVGQRHQNKATQTRLDVFLRNTCLSARKLAGQHGIQRLHGRADIDRVERDAIARCQIGSIIKTVLTGIR